MIPFDLVYSSKHFRREMRGLDVPHGVYVAVTGTDLIRQPDGQFAVLEDNLRVPSGASYMLANRQVHEARLPQSLWTLWRAPAGVLRPGAAHHDARPGAGTATR